jgi:hypothetical protein
MKWARLFSAIASTLLSSSVFAAGPFGTIHVGNWHGGAWTNDTTGAFSHCAAGADFANGLSLLISQNAERTWLIGFTSPSWNFPEPYVRRPITVSNFRNRYTTKTHIGNPTDPGVKYLAQIAPDGGSW